MATNLKMEKLTKNQEKKDHDNAVFHIQTLLVHIIDAEYQFPLIWTMENMIPQHIQNSMIDFFNKFSLMVNFESVMELKSDKQYSIRGLMDLSNYAFTYKCSINKLDTFDKDKFLNFIAKIRMKSLAKLNKYCSKCIEKATEYPVRIQIKYWVTNELINNTKKMFEKNGFTFIRKNEYIEISKPPTTVFIDPEELIDMQCEYPNYCSF